MQAPLRPLVQGARCLRASHSPVSGGLFSSFLFLLSSPALSLSLLLFCLFPPLTLSSLFLSPLTLWLVLSPFELSPPFKLLYYGVLAAIGLLVLCVLVIPEREWWESWRA